MKLQIRKKFIPFVILIMGIVAFSSCNRGYGCPNNFSLEVSAVEVDID